MRYNKPHVPVVQWIEYVPAKDVIAVRLCTGTPEEGSPLRLNIFDTLREFDFFPTVSTKNRIMLRKRNDVINFFNLVKPNNKKHLVRYALYLKMCEG